MAGAILLLTLALALGRDGGLLSGIHQPPWLWLIGPLGAAIVVVLAYPPPLIGTFATIALMIAGQLVAGALIDAFGLLGSPRIPLTASRAAGLMLVAAGAAFTLNR